LAIEVEDVVALAVTIAASLIVIATLAGIALGAGLLLLGCLGVLVKGIASIPIIDRYGTRVIDDALRHMRGSNVGARERAGLERGARERGPAR
jgi:hypothetical protein